MDIYKRRKKAILALYSMNSQNCEEGICIRASEYGTDFDSVYSEGLPISHESIVNL